jgi:competence protein ComEC
MKKFFSVLLWLGALALIAHAIWQVHVLRMPLPQAFYQPTWVHGTVVGLPVQKGHAMRVDISVPQGRFRLYAYGHKEAMVPGHQYDMRIKLRPIVMHGNPGEFDYLEYLHSQGIRGTGTLYYAKPIGAAWYKAPVSAWRGVVRAGMTALILHLKYQGIMLALGLGDKALLTPAIWQVFRHTGTSHLVAISGLHIGLVAAAVFFVFRYVASAIPWVVLRLPAQTIGLCVSLFAALLYSAMAGFAVPTERSLVMIGVVTGAMLFKRQVAPLDAILLAFVLVLLINPFNAGSVSFWLSFMAVGSLLYAYVYRMGQLRFYDKWIHPQWVVALMLTPISIYFFSQNSWVSFLSNIVAIPVVSFCGVPLVLLGMLSMGISHALAYGLFWCANKIMGWLWIYLSWLSSWPHLGAHYAHPSIALMILATCGAIYALLPRAVPVRWAGLTLVLPLFFVRPTVPAMGHMRVTRLNMKRGLAVIVQTHVHTVVIAKHTPFLRHYYAGRSDVMPALRVLGVSKIDDLIVGQKQLHHVRVTTLKSSWVEAQLAKAPALQFGQAWHYDGVRFTVLNRGNMMAASQHHKVMVRVMPLSATAQKRYQAVHAIAPTPG